MTPDRQLSSVLALGWALIAAPAFAQETSAPQPAANAPGQGLGEIVVTARRRAENIQNVPISVSAFNADTLKARGLSDTTQLANAVPNVMFASTSSFSGASSTFQGFIRGIGQSDFAVNTDPGVGVYIDGVYIARTVGAVTDLMDVNSVEVLKGPQGTLFGRNTIGGAINITTRDPGPKFGFRGMVQYGNYNQINTGGSLNMPISETLGATFSFVTHARDGYQERIAFPGASPTSGAQLGQILVADKNSGAKSGAENNQTLRGKLRYRKDGLTATLSADYSRIRDAAPPTSLLTTTLDPVSSLSALYNGCVMGAAPRGLCAASPYINYGVGNAALYDNRYLTGNIDKTYATGANFSNMDSWGTALSLNYEFSPNLSVKSITAYRSMKARFGADIDGSPLDIDQTTFAINEHQFSQELQLNGKALNRLTYTLGGYYFKEYALQTDFVPLGQGLLQIYGPNTQWTYNGAIFGEGTFAVTPRFNLVLGGRYTDEVKRLQLDQRNLTNFFDLEGLPANAFPRADHSYLGPDGVQRVHFHNFSIRAGANYKLTRDTMAYFTFSQGFKSGGFTTRLTAPYNPAFPGNSLLPSLAFQPEKNTLYEIGLKNELFDHRVRLNMAAFWNDYRDIQVVVQAGITPANENAAQGRIRGFEGELDAKVTSRLRIGGSLGYLDAKYTSLTFPAGTAPFGINARFQNTPTWTASASANYTLPLRSGAKIDLNASDSYRSSVYLDAENSPQLFQRAVNLVNLSVAYTVPSGALTLSLGGKNVFDKRYKIAGYVTPSVGFAEATYNRPAEWYARAEFHF
ncbi:TonB-dependent receptor [Novosphingobium rosa]|uniref:TonB-dependent receptor n=1 Tax=Novosphingobium rosa TaxID=76978 RepID=UPI00082AE09C|nr:TonB-dependent receptor [Novosphingobium rosa]